MRKFALARMNRCLAERRLDLGQFPAAVLEKDFLKASAELHRLLADELEALIELLEDLLRHEHSCLKRLLHVGILGDLAEFLKDPAAAVLCLAARC
jgi:hypothetical protein